MTPERWRRIEELYHAADALPVADRHAFLLQACPDDDELLREVDGLLNQPQSGREFLDQPATLSGSLIEDNGHGPMTGQRIGDYEVRALLGAGGMGEVYRARDAKIGRDVALKILPRAFVGDADRLARFEREARMLGALNHPGICAIYGIENADGVRVLVLELVEGETLADLLKARARAGTPGLPQAKALSIARQVAEALEVAHEKGIVHRDLKPANIKITPDGIVKVLDFGLAKPVGGDGSAPDLTLPPPATSGVERGGLLIGTPAYMSPEQARGLPVDKRTDIWAFGCVLYEMLAGRGAFAGETSSDSIAKVLEREPDWTALPSETPDSIRRLLLRCLTKNPRQRVRDIGDVRIEIDGLDGTAAAAGEKRTRQDIARGRVTWLPWVAIAVLITALGILGAWTLRPTSAPPIARFALSLPPDQALNGSRGAHIVAISPDGTRFVYSGLPHGLYLRSLADLDVTMIPGTEGFEVTEPVFSPDGQSIAFFTVVDQAIEKIAATGGQPQMLCKVEQTPTGISWGRDGIVFGQNADGIYRVSPNGGAPEPLVRLNPGEAAHGPQVLPDGEHILFTLATGTASTRWDRARIVVRSLKTQEQKVVIDGGSDGRYLPSGHLAFAISGGLQAVAFDAGSLQVIGERVQVVDGVRRAAGAFTGAAAFSASATGTLVYVPGPLAGEGSVLLDLATMDRTGVVQPLHLQPGIYAYPTVSPDGTRVAFQSDDGKEAIVYTYDLSGASTMQRLTTGGNNRFPIWVTDKRVAFQSDRGGDLGIWWQGLDGVAEPLTKAASGSAHAPESWFGDTLLYSVTKGTDVSLWALSLKDRSQKRFDTPPSSAPTGAVFSPNGEWVAYSTTQGSHMTMYVQRFPAGPRYPLSAKETDTPKQPRWSRDGREIFYNPNVGAFESVRILATDPLTFGKGAALPKSLQSGPPGSRTNYDVAPDGRLIGLVTAGQREYVRGPVNQIRVVLNWFEDLKARAHPNP